MPESKQRALPIRLDPISGEALDSWLAALAYRLHTPLGELLPELGLPRRSVDHTGSIPTEWTVLLRPSEINALAGATGAGRSTIEAMTLCRYDGQALFIDHATRQVRRGRLWGRNTGSRYCPDCLAETGGRWQLSWRLGWSFACPAHRRLLADSCPRCGRIPRRRPMIDLSRPGLCVQPAGPEALGKAAPRCGTDLTSATTTRFPEDHPVLHAQQLLLDVINEGKARFGVYSVATQPTLTALSDLRALAARILRYADRDDLNTLPRDLLVVYDHALAQPAGHHWPARAPARPGFMAPAHSAIAAVGVTAAIAVLDADTIRHAGTSLRRLLEAGRRNGTAVTPTTVGGWGKGTSATLKAIQLSALGPLLKPTAQLRYRTAADTPCHQLPADTAISRHHRLPAMLWTAWALRLRPDKGIHMPTLRPALSAVLLLAGTRRTLHDATQALSAVTDPRDTSRVLQQLEANPRWPHILTAMTRLADYLDSATVPIDYHRRRHLDYSDLLPDEQWHHLCQQTGFLAGRQRRLRLARCLLFEKISGMPAERAPAPFAVDTPYTRDRLLHFAAHLTADVTTHLGEAAQDFLARRGIRNEPVEWQPPTSLLDDLDPPGDNPALIDIPTLHRLVHTGRGPLTDAAQQLGITLDTVRHLLEHHPAPPQPLSVTQAHATGHRRFTARRAFSKDLLTYLYTEQQLSLREIGQRAGVSRGTITRLFEEYGIPRHERRRPSGSAINREWLYDQYVNHRRTLPDLADETGMSTANMARWAKTHNIPLRPRGGGSHNQVRVTLGQATTAPHVLRPAFTGHGAWGRLRRFAAAAEHPTIGTAATALGLNPPTLVTQINRLERDLGGQLLTRAKRGQPMVLTPLGRKVIAAIRRHCSESSQHQRAWRAAVPPCRTATPPLPRPHLASPFGDPYNR